MNDSFDTLMFYTILILSVIAICLYGYIDQTTKESSSVKAEPVETLVPTHTAKCTETKGNTCITYTIYRITNP